MGNTEFIINSIGEGKILSFVWYNDNGEDDINSLTNLFTRVCGIHKGKPIKLYVQRPLFISPVLFDLSPSNSFCMN